MRLLSTEKCDYCEKTIFVLDETSFVRSQDSIPIDLHSSIGSTITAFRVPVIFCNDQCRIAYELSK